MEEIVSENLLRWLPVLLTIVLQAGMLIVPLYCVVKRPTPPAYVMLVGIVLEIPGSLFTLWWSMWGTDLNMPLQEVSRYFGITGTVSHVGALLYACGFLLFIHDALRKRVSI